MSTQCNSTASNKNSTILHVMNIMSVYYQTQNNYSIDTIRHAFHAQEERRRLSAFQHLTTVRDNFFSIKLDLIKSMIEEPGAWEKREVTAVGMTLQQSIISLSSRKPELLKFCDDHITMEFLFQNFNLIYPYINRIEFEELTLNESLKEDFECFIEANNAAHELLKRGASIQATVDFTLLPRELINVKLFNDATSKSFGQIKSHHHNYVHSKMDSLNSALFTRNDELSIKERMNIVYYFTSTTDRNYSFSAVRHIIQLWSKDTDSMYSHSLTKKKIDFLCRVFGIVTNG